MSYGFTCEWKECLGMWVAISHYSESLYGLGNTPYEAMEELEKKEKEALKK